MQLVDFLSTVSEEDSSAPPAAAAAAADGADGASSSGAHSAAAGPSGPPPSAEATREFAELFPESPQLWEAMEAIAAREAMEARDLELAYRLLDDESSGGGAGQGGAGEGGAGPAGLTAEQLSEIELADLVRRPAFPLLFHPPVRHHALRRASDAAHWTRMDAAGRCECARRPSPLFAPRPAATAGGAAARAAPGPAGDGLPRGARGVRAGAGGCPRAPEGSDARARRERKGARPDPPPPHSLALSLRRCSLGGRGGASGPLSARASPGRRPPRAAGAAVRCREPVPPALAGRQGRGGALHRPARRQEAERHQRDLRRPPGAPRHPPTEGSPRFPTPRRCGAARLLNPRRAPRRGRRSCRGRLSRSLCSRTKTPRWRGSRSW